MSQISSNSVSWMCPLWHNFFPSQYSVHFYLDWSCWLVTSSERATYFYRHRGVSNYFFRLSDYCSLQIITAIPKDFSSSCTIPPSLQSTQILNCFSVMFPLSHIPSFPMFDFLISNYYVWSIFTCICESHSGTEHINPCSQFPDIYSSAHGRTVFSAVW